MCRCCPGMRLPFGLLVVLVCGGLVAAGWSVSPGIPMALGVQEQEKQEQTAKAQVKTKQDNQQDSEKAVEKVLETATFGSGCYWCTEAVFQRVTGVEKVVSGFMGGHVANPTYEQVCTGLTGHAEVLQVQFDPTVVSYEKLLEIFWSSHDPTTLNRQGNDIGPMYRSAIFYHSEEQKLLAVKYKDKLNEAKAFNAPIVTEITESSEFYAAPDYHQDYYNRNKKKNPYCQMITYKLQNFRKAFKDVIDKDKDKVK
jgi:peptide-methionine (S)-S-oxide reductase